MPKKVLKIILLGDIALHGLFVDEPAKNKTRFKEAEGFLSNADLVFGNLETPVDGEGKFHLKKREKMGVLLYSNRQTISTILPRLNIAALSLANNHIFDCLHRGVQNTIETLESLGITRTGAGTESADIEPVILEKNGLRIGFLAYVHPSSNPFITGDEKREDIFINLYREEEIISQIDRLKKKADHIIVSVHWGVDYSHYPTAAQQHSYRKLIDAGADIIMGHHSHTIQPFEVYKNRYIFYSLGSFCFGDFLYGGELRGLKRKTKKSIAPLLTLDQEIKLDCLYSLRELKGNTIIQHSKSLNGFLNRKLFFLKLKNRYKPVEILISVKESFFDRIIEYFFGYYRNPLKQLIQIGGIKKIKYAIRDYRNRKKKSAVPDKK